MANTLIVAIKDNKAQVEEAIKAAPDWSIATKHFDALFSRMANPKDTLWSKAMIDELHTVYYKARAEDKKCKNITERTIKAMPKAKANDTKKIFLQIASTCRIFHASHKVNFDPLEIPAGFDEIPMTTGKKKGFLTYAENMPTLYQKISLTFDYWVPKILDWTQELREKGLTDWKEEASMQHESCTDFMRIALMFLSDIKNNLPIAKWDVREAILNKCFDQEFIWIKKSARQEDILVNSKALLYHLGRVAAETNLTIPTEAWSRILNLKCIKEQLK